MFNFGKKPLNLFGFRSIARKGFAAGNLADPRELLGVAGGKGNAKALALKQVRQ